MKRVGIEDRARQCSQNVDVNGPHHRCFELIVSSSFHPPMVVERGRSHELVGSMVGAVYVHVLRTLGHVAIFPSSSLLHARTTRPISPYSPRFFVTMHTFSTVPSFRFQAVVYRVEIPHVLWFRFLKLSKFVNLTLSCLIILEYWIVLIFN